MLIYFSYMENLLVDRMKFASYIMKTLSPLMVWKPTHTYVHTKCVKKFDKVTSKLRSNGGTLVDWWGMSEIFSPFSRPGGNLPFSRSLSLSLFLYPIHTLWRIQILVRSENILVFLVFILFFWYLTINLMIFAHK